MVEENWDLITISDKLYNSKDEFAISTSEAYKILGFYDKRSMEEFLKRNDIEHQKRWTYMNKRKSFSMFIRKSDFINLANKRISDNDEWLKLLQQYKRWMFESRILRFKTFRKGTFYPHGIYNDNIWGVYHEYSLDTLTLAKDLDLDPLDVFVFCFKVFSKKYFIKNPIMYHESYRSNTYMPIFAFNSYFSDDREIFFKFVEDLVEHFSFGKIQRLIAKEYLATVKEMHKRQCAEDKKKGRSPNSERTFKVKFEMPKVELTEVQKAELKINYRKASVICHPDKLKKENKEKGNLYFAKLNKLYKAEDLVGLNKLYQEIKTVFK